MYHYMRFRWGEGLDIDTAMDELLRDYSVKRRDFPGDNVEITLYGEDRVELMVSADTLRIHMNAHRAILNQIEAGPFTRRDMALREYVLTNYPRSRPTPFPWSFYFEPEFEVEE